MNTSLLNMSKVALSSKDNQVFDRDEREEFLDMPTDKALAELMEDHLGSGWMLVDPEDVGALTNAPMLTDDWGYDEDGNLEIGQIYWFPDYAVRNEIKEILSRKGAFFESVL